MTAGNASGVNDGAAALVLMDADRAKSLGIEVLAFVGSSAAAGVAPAEMGIGPVPAIQRVMQRANLPLDAIDLVELNEALAAQAVACCEALGLISPK